MKTTGIMPFESSHGPIDDAEPIGAGSGGPSLDLEDLPDRHLRARAILVFRVP